MNCVLLGFEDLFSNTIIELTTSALSNQRATSEYTIYLTSKFSASISKNDFPLLVLNHELEVTTPILELGDLPNRSLYFRIRA